LALAVKHWLISWTSSLCFNSCQRSVRDGIRCCCNTCTCAWRL